MSNLDCLVDDGAVLLGVLFLVDHRLILGLVVGRGRQGRRVLVHFEKRESRVMVVRLRDSLSYSRNLVSECLYTFPRFQSH